MLRVLGPKTLQRKHRHCLHSVEITLIFAAYHTLEARLKSARTIVLIAAGLLVAACVSTQAVRLGNAPIRPPVAPDKINIYLTPDRVPGRYDEVALLSSKGDAGFTSESKMYDSMRKKAGELGANGIILQNVEEPGTGAKVFHALIGTSADRKGKALAIFLLPDSSAKKP
jgi:hypothetical protein